MKNPIRSIPCHSPRRSPGRPFRLGLAGLFMGLAFQVFAQPGPGFKGHRLGPEINTEYDEAFPRLDLQARTMYFVRSGNPYNAGGQDIWISRKLVDGSWGQARNAGAPLNDERHNAVGGAPAAEDVLYLCNLYGVNGPGISTARREKGWGMPEPLLTGDDLGLQDDYFDFFVDVEQSILLISMKHRDHPGSGTDLYISRREFGGWTRPVSLGDKINTKGSEISPSMRSDGRYLFFASDGHGGEGGMDIFVAERLGDTWQSWSEPVNLGKAVNTPGFDGHFIMDAGYEKAYFVSGESKTAPGDIYEIAVDDIPYFEKEVPVAVQADTLRIFAKENTPQPVSFDAFGIPESKAPLCSGKSLDGRGKLLIRQESPSFVYQPAPGFRGTEHLLFTYCALPHSDQCQEVVVLARVEPEDGHQPPKFVTIRSRTSQNTPVKLDLNGRMAEMVDLAHSNAHREAPQGTVARNRETGGEHLLYRPGPDFTGTDTLDLFMHCDKPDPEDCLMARVLIEVYPDAAVVVDEEEAAGNEPLDPVEPEPVRVDTVVQAVEPLPSPTGEILISGKITDEKTGEPIQAELVFRELPSERELKTLSSDPETGAFELRLPAGKEYTITAREKYHFEASSLVPATAGEEIRRDIRLLPLIAELGQVIRLENIYFDLNKATLKPESRAELGRLYEFLKANPGLHIRIEGHTDSWSDDAYNLALSQARCESVVNYLKYRGVMGTRLEARGFGESVPVADNETEEGRAQNRRVEFRVIKE